MKNQEHKIDEKKADLREALAAYAQFYSQCNIDGSVGPDEVKKLKELQERIKVCEQELKLLVDEIAKNDTGLTDDFET